MSSPAKKRKLNGGGKAAGGQSKGLEFFFAKQRQTQPQRTDTSSRTEPTASAELTDEEFARKLQAEFDQEGQSAAISGEDTTTNSEIPLSESQNNASQHLPSLPPVESLPAKIDHAASSQQENKSGSTLALQSTGVAEDMVTNSIPLDEPPLTFEPSKYVTALRSHWASEGGNASYALLTRCFVLVSGTTSRIKIVDTLVNCLRILIEGDASSLLPAVSLLTFHHPQLSLIALQVWLATNSISPAYISLELGLGGSAISKALKQVCGLDNRSLKAIYDKHGDAGDVAFEAKKKQSFTLKKPKPLSIKGVYQSLVKISTSQGHGSGEVKQRLVDRLLQDARGGEESRFIVRTLCQHVSYLVCLWAPSRH